MGDLFRLSVVTGESTVLDTKVRSVNLPMDFGSIGILVNHAPMLCAGRLKTGASSASASARASPAWPTTS